MTSTLLAELSTVFSLEAFEVDLRGDQDEADRLWDIAEELSQRSKERTMKRSFQKFEKRLQASALHAEVTRRALVHHVTLQDLYEGADRSPSVSAARQAVYMRLWRLGKGVNEIARLFDRAPSGVWRMLHR